MGRSASPFRKNLAHKERDWASLNFVQWFVKEQLEEETLFSNLLDKYIPASSKQDDNINLYDLDKDIAKASQEAAIPQEEKF